MLKKLSTAFYDAMFGTNNTDSEINHIEERALRNVREILNSPQQLSKQIPPLPVTLLQLIDILKDPNSNFDEITKLIEQDPGLAVEVLRVSNSSLYFRGNQEVTSIRNAVALLGISGITNISTTLLLEKVKPSKPIYYKMFGKQIWIHSVQCAFLCKTLAIENKNDEFDAYFLGLIHDVGKIIIFNCLCDALSKEFPGSKPGSQAFKELMAEMSAHISYFIAVEWKLPAIYCEALDVQREVTSSVLSEQLYKGNLLSELYLLYKRGQINDTLIEAILEKLSVKKSIWEEFVEMAPKIEKSVH